VTPITPTAVVSIAVLAHRGRPVEARQVSDLAGRIDEYIAVEALPVTESLRLEQPAEVRRVLNQLAAHGSVTLERIEDDVWCSLDHGQALQAAYYRNVVLHHFVPGSIAELALLGASASGRADDVWTLASDVRDLLKFEFFFPEREAYLEQIRRELDAVDRGWESKVGSAPQLLADAELLRADWALLALLDAYQVVADELVAGRPPAESKAFIDGCLTRGKRYRLEGRIDSDESVSKVVFATALKLINNRELTEASSADERQALADEIERYRSLASRIAALAGREPAPGVTN
jgi:glycerol-3-phosphate O-acyltransferase